MRPRKYGVLGSVVLVFVLIVGIGAGSAQDSDIAKRLYQSATKFLKEGKWEQAKEDLEKIYRSFPASEYADEAYFAAGDYHLSQREYKKAIENFEAVSKGYGDSNMAPAAHFKLGQLHMDPHYENQDFVEAYANFSRVFTIYRNSEWVDDTLYYAGLALIQLREFDNAHGTFRRMLREYPHSQFAAKAQYEIGRVTMYAGDLLGAIEEFQRARLNYDDAAVSARALDAITHLYRMDVRRRVEPKKPLYILDESFKLGRPTIDRAVALAIEEGGRLVVADKGAKRVLWFDQGGELVKTQDGVKDPRDIATDSTGRVLVATEDLVYVDSDPVKIPYRYGDDTEPLKSPSVIAPGPGLDYYVYDEKSEVSVHVGRDNIPVGVFPPRLSHVPSDMTRTFLGDLLVVYPKIERVHRVGADGTVIGEIKPEGEEYELRRPTKIATDLMGNVFVLDEKTNSVVVFSSKLEFLGRIAPSEDSPAYFKSPVDIAVDDAGRLYVYDDKTERVLRFR